MCTNVQKNTFEMRPEPPDAFLELPDSSEHVVTRVPSEILVQIFFYSTYQKPLSRTGSSPLGLSHVCSYWRITALSTPELWSTLYIDFSWEHLDSIGYKFTPESLRYKPEDDCTFPEIWFNRAKSQPLTFILKEVDCWRRKPRYLDLLSAVGMSSISSRLTELQLSPDLWSKHDLSKILTLPGDSFPVLEKLTLRYNDDELVTAFSNSPLLRSVTFMTDIDSVLIQNLHAWQWGQLTRFECNTTVGSDVWRRILRQMVNIQWCSIRVRPVNEDIPSATPATVLTHLAFLKIRFLIVDSMRELSIFHSIRIPALKSYVQDGGNLYPRTSVHLTSLVLTKHYTGNIGSLRNFLSRCVSLERLAIQTERLLCSTFHEWEAWTWLHEHLPPLPHLNTIVFGLLVYPDMKDMTRPADAFCRIAMSFRSTSVKNFWLFVGGKEEGGRELCRLVDNLQADPDLCSSDLVIRTRFIPDRYWRSIRHRFDLSDELGWTT
ncbi:hypothetical protein E4T56_gene11767 [Termitomyces sp. T112]|nr:hypothetical protein E4T56_gene11767 [Termitomyces sp. T112]